MNTGFTQVLSDGTNTYLYGLSRLAERGSGANEYYLGDALGSVRQLTNNSGEVTLTRRYDPYGKASQSGGSSQTEYGFTGEAADASGLIYLRARYYAPADGHFLSRDTWEGDINNPITFNRWTYANANPVNLVDPSGRAAGLLDPNGYSEGKMSNFTGLFANWVVRGEELVYDFETLERAKFSVTARIDEETGEEHWIAGGCTSIVNFTGATYTSVIFGFDQDDGIVKDYSGVSKSIGGGFSIIGVGTGAILFSSVDRGTSSINWDVVGISFYQELGIDISLSLILEAGAMVIEYQPIDVVKKYNSIDELAQDIVKGEGSPINTYIGLKKAREAAVEQARHYREIWK